MITKTHSFFLAELNPMPLLISVNTFNLLFSFLVFLKMNFILNFAMSTTLTVYCMFFWWMNYTKEFSMEGKSSLSLDKGLKMSMILFISSEILFFFSFFWSYFHYFLAPSMDVGMTWPVENLKMFDYSNVPLLNTVILLGSGILLTCSHFFLMENMKFMCIKFLSATILLGVLFTVLQSIEYISSFFSLNDGNFGTIFFVLTGFHGLHVIIGTFYLSVVWIKINTSQISSNIDISFELSSWYWHFVDVVWLFLYFFLYYLNF